MKRGIVFDMDKCIGYFTQIALYIDIIEELSRKLKLNEHYQLFNMFPEIFRPGIFNVFRYLVRIKKKGKLEVIIYTNNNGPPTWATTIRKYIEYKIKHKLFDRTIKGWKYNNKIIEEKRSGYEKSWKDLIECTRLTKNDKIIFFDDRDEHYGMKHENVNYVKVAPYRSGILHKDFVDKFIKSNLNKKLKINKEHLIRECNRSGYRPKFREVSNNDIIKPLREFLKNIKKTTRRIKRKGKKTRKGGRRNSKKNKAVNKYGAPHTLPNTTTQQLIDNLNHEQLRRMMEIIGRRRENLTQMHIPEERQELIIAHDLEDMNQNVRAQIQQQQQEQQLLAQRQQQQEQLAQQIEELREQIRQQEQQQQQQQEQGRVVTATPRDINRRGPPTRREQEVRGVETQTNDDDDD